jgi:hypothetical protein
MNNQTDTVTNQTYEVTPPPIQAGQAPRPPVAQGRRDFFDDPRRKSPVLALVLSLMPGLGQVYIGYYQQGFTNVLVAASIIAVLNSELAGGAEPLLGIFLGFFWLYNIVDAWRRATFYNNALAGIGPAAMPEDFTAPGSRGSLAGGVALVLVGVIALSHTLFGMPLDWIEKWWPIALVGVGGWLIYPSIAGKKGTDAAA